jgi:DNA-binding transcriptional regulator YhcF (GntR family)
MMVVVERNTDEPVYEQIARQIRRLIASGELTPGMPLPTVRTLAADLGINLNTVARAYWRLEEEGFIRIRDRSGAEIMPPIRKTNADRNRLCEEMKNLLARMYQAGFSSQELRRVAEREIASLVGSEEK